jgi:hypothetical protein
MKAISFDMGYSLLLVLALWIFNKTNTIRKTSSINKRIILVPHSIPFGMSY